MILPRAIICDLDGCLADHRHRLCFIDPEVAGKKKWDAFYATMDKDEVNE